MDHWFMGLAPENLLAENNLVKTVTLIKWNWEGRRSSSSITGCWFFCWYCLLSPVMVGFLTLPDLPRWHMRAPSDLSFFGVAATRVQAGRQRILSEALDWKWCFLKLIFLNCVSEPPVALAEMVFSRGLNVLTPGPTGFLRARSSSRQWPDSVAGSWLPTLFVNRSFYHPWWSSPSFQTSPFCCSAMNTVWEWIRSRKPRTVGHLRLPEW